jgi:hypothetical protein
MTKKKRPPAPVAKTSSEPTPPGATREAFERDRAEGHGGPPHTPLRDRYAVSGPPETVITGLAGVEDGDTRDVEGQDPLENGPPYAGHAGGAVGGTPAEHRARGGEVHGGLAPGGDRPMDTTIGSEPSKRKRR